MIDQVAESLSRVQTRAGYLLNLIVLTGDAKDQPLSVKLIDDDGAVALSFLPNEGMAYQLMSRYASEVLAADGFDYDPNTHTVNRKREVSDAVTQATDSDGNEARIDDRNSRGIDRG
jgi:hypothetical protein